jgi:hypothetical protein
MFFIEFANGFPHSVFVLISFGHDIGRERIIHFSDRSLFFNLFKGVGPPVFYLPEMAETYVS